MEYYGEQRKGQLLLLPGAAVKRGAKQLIKQIVTNDDKNKYRPNKVCWTSQK